MKKVKILLVLIGLFVFVATAFSSCTPSHYTLSASSIPAASGDINPSSGTYDKGVEVVITANPTAGYRFDHWEGAASGNSPTLHLVMDGDKKLEAYFTKTYTLSVSCTPPTGGTISPNSGTYDEGIEMTLIATPAMYYRFDEWDGDVSGTSTHVTIRMNSDKTVVASFSKASCTLQTQVDPLGGGTIQPSSGTYEAGTQISIVATPATGYVFDHWSGGVSGTSSALSFVIDTNKTLTAYFTKAYLLSVSYIPEGSCTIEPSGGLYRAGTKMTLTATTVFPYVFSHWSGTDSDSMNPTTVTMNADKSVMAYSSKCVGGVCTYYGKQPPYARTSLGHDSIELVNNPNAIDPTWQQLKEFLVADQTDAKTYDRFFYMCGAFAEDVHNNAEIEGIKAAWVAVDFEGGGAGHALDVFQTTDKGLVYVDCTGESGGIKYRPILPPGQGKVFGEVDEWDKVAYMAVGEEYGSISLNAASCFAYSCYESYEQRKANFDIMLNEYNENVKTYNSEVEAYESWISGKVFYVGSPEAQRADDWYAELNREKQSLDLQSQAIDREGDALGAFWEPLGTVSRIEIYW